MHTRVVQSKRLAVIEIMTNNVLKLKLLKAKEI